MLTRSGAVAGLLSAAVIGALAPAAVTRGAVAGTPAAQSLRQVWTVGAGAAWAWTQGEQLGSPQALDRTVNGGKSWRGVTPPGLSKQSGDHVITGFYALDAAHAWVTYGGIDEGTTQTITATSDGGRRWTVVAKAPLADFNDARYNCDLDFVTPADGWCVSTPVAISDEEAVFAYRTTDGGQRWRLVSSTTGESPPAGALPLFFDKNIQFTGAETGWAIFGTSGAVTAPLYESRDGGRTWVKRTVTTAPGPLDYGSGFAGQPVLAGGRGAVGYTVDGKTKSGAKTVVYVTADNGATWRPVTPPGGPDGWLVDAITPESWRLVAGDRILATDNGGKTWRTIKSDVTFSQLSYPYDDPTPPTVDFATARTGWIADTTAMGTTLWRTTDGGSTWGRVTVPGT